MVKARSSISQTRESGFGTTTLYNMMKKMPKRAGIESRLSNHCLRASSVTVLSNHNCETRHIKSITAQKSDQAVESYKGPSMEQQRKMSLVLSDFIGNVSSGSATSVQGKENEIQQQCRPTPDEFPHQEPERAITIPDEFEL